MQYLVVAHQTAASAELQQHLTRLATEDADARFTLVVPATDPAHLLVWEPGEAHSIAGSKAEMARQKLVDAGVPVVRTQVGDAEPMQAIRDELRVHPGMHDAIILCTLPPGVSRWIGLDLPTLASQQFTVPVTHIVAGAATESGFNALVED